MAVTAKLGAQFATVREKLKFKTVNVKFEDAEFALKVRIPLKAEMEAITERIQNPSKDAIEAIYNQYAQPVLATIKEAGDGFIDALNETGKKMEVLDDDVVVDGTSVRQVAYVSAMWQAKVEEYFHLLQSDTGEPITESYEEITAEFPEQVIRLIVDEIDAALKPDYSAAKKNSGGR